MQDRAYQGESVERVFAAHRAGVRRVLLTMPTGAGKTVVAVLIILRLIKLGLAPILFFAHRRELIQQTFAKLIRGGLPPESVGVVMAGTTSAAGRSGARSLDAMTDREVWAAFARRRPGAPVQVASIDTYRNRAQIQARACLVDECHRALSPTYSAIQRSLPDALHIGFTATPIGPNGKGMRPEYDELIVGARYSQLVELGHLVEPMCWGTEREIDTSGIRRSGGDYSSKDLAQIVDKRELTGDIVQHWRERGNDAATFAFAVNVEHSQHIAARFNEAWIPAMHVDGGTDTTARDDAFEALREGRIKVLSNCDVCTEGTDVPRVKTIIMARPTLSVRVYLQQAGRGSRPYQGQDFVILDHAGNCSVKRLGGLPHWDREWTLDGIAPPKKATISLPPVKKCEGCFALVPIATRECPGCGFVFPIAEAETAIPVEKEGALVLLTAKQTERLDAWDALVAEWRTENERRDAAGEPLRAGGACTYEWRNRTGSKWPPKGSKIPRLTAEQERVSEERRAAKKAADRTAAIERRELEAAAKREAERATAERRQTPVRSVAATELEEWRV